MATRTPAESESGGQPSGIKLPQLPLRELGLEYVPAVPVDIGGLADTLSKLVIRVKQREQALQGLSKTFTIGGSSARAYNFLFGGGASDAKAAAAHFTGPRTHHQVPNSGHTTYRRRAGGVRR